MFGLNFRRDLVDVGVAATVAMSELVVFSLGEDAGVPANVGVEATTDDTPTNQIDEEAG